MCIAWTVQPVFLMTHLSRSKRCWQFVRLLFTVCVSCVLLSGAGTAPLEGEPRDTRERYIELDGEIQAIKEEILEINRDILLLEELSLYPHGQQLVVLVSVANNSALNPDSISLQLDGKALGHHSYTGSERAALQEGGVHRLYAGRLSDGEYVLDVSVSGKQAGNRAFHQQRSVTITKLPGRKYLELQLGPGKNMQNPGLTVREW